MGLEIKRLKVVVEGEDDGLKDVEDGVERATGKTQRLGGVITQALGNFAGNLMTRATDAVVDFVKKGVDGFSDLQQQVANVSSIKPSIDTSAVFDSLNMMQTRIPETADKLGGALYNVFSSMEVSQKEGLKLVEDFAKGAVGAVTDAETFGTSIMGVLNAYKLQVKDANHIQDLFFNTVKAGVVSGQELASSLGPVTQAAKAAGQSTDMLFASIAAVTKEGGPAAQNINNLNNAYQKLTTAEAVKNFKALGVEVTANGKYRDMVSILTDLKAKLAPLSEEARNLQLQKIFPDAQARQGIQTLLSQLDFLKKTLKENQTEAGAAAKAYETMSGTFENQSKILQNTVSAIGTEIASVLLPMITPMLSFFAKELPGAIKQVEPVLQSVGKWFVEATAPIMPVVRDVANFVIQTFGTIVKWFQSNLPLIKTTVETVLAVVAALWGAFGGTIKSLVKTALDVVLNIVKLAMQILTGDWKGAIDSIVKIVGGLGKFIWTALTGIVSIIRGLGKAIIDAAVDIGRFIWEGIVTGIKTGASAITEAVIGLANSAVAGFKKQLKIKSPSQVFYDLAKEVVAGFVGGLTGGRALLDGTAAKAAQWVVDAWEKSHQEALNSVMARVKASRREFLAAVYGPDSAAVMRFDFPELSRDEAINLAAQINRNKELAAAYITLKNDGEAHQRAISEWLRLEAEAAAIGGIKGPAPDFGAANIPVGPINLPLRHAVRTVNTGLMAKRTDDPSRLRADLDPIMAELGNLAEQRGRRFLSDLLGGNNRGDILGSLWNEMTNLGRDALSSLIEGGLRKNLMGVLREVGKSLDIQLDSLRLSTSTVLQVVGAAYQLIAASQRKKQFGLGSIIGAVGGFFLGGPQGAIAGYNIGNALDNGDYAGAIIGGVTATAGGAFKGGGGTPSNEYAGNSGWGKSRSVDVTYNHYGDVNNASDVDDLRDEVTGAVQSGLRIVTV